MQDFYVLFSTFVKSLERVSYTVQWEVRTRSQFYFLSEQVMWRLNDCPLKPSLWTCSLYLQHALTIQRSYLNADIASYYLHTILSQRRHRFNFDNHAGSQFFSRLETPDREFKYVRDMHSSHSLRKTRSLLYEEDLMNWSGRDSAAVFAQLLLVTREHHEEVLLQALQVSG